MVYTVEEKQPRVGEYRIVQKTDGRIIVEKYAVIRETRTHLIFWWIKKEAVDYKWLKCDSLGRAFATIPSLSGINKIPPHRPFKTIHEAKMQIDLWKGGDVYFYPERDDAPPKESGTCNQ